MFSRRGWKAVLATFSLPFVGWLTLREEYWWRIKHGIDDDDDQADL
jgi:hypothetical protein